MKIMSQKVPVSELGRKRRISRFRVMLLNLANQAMRGDLAAQRMILSLNNGSGAQSEETLPVEKLTLEELKSIENMYQRVYNLEDR